MTSRLSDSIANYPLFKALVGRRSRRFATGAALDGGPLTYRSSVAAEPLTLDEEAALAYAAAGITGYALAELPYTSGTNPESGGGNIMVHLVGRTIASGDALHSVVLFVLNDDGTWMIRRPQDFPAEDIPSLIAEGRDGRLVELYERTRVRVLPKRAVIDRKIPLVPPFNLWDANIPGTTYFLPVTEFTPLYLNVLLAAFSEELGFYILDDHAGFRPAGVSRLRRSRGGHLYDDPNDGRIMTIGYLETALATIAAAEEGAMHQNLALMAEALGLGGFTHACRFPGWLKALGFETLSVPFSRAAALDPVTTGLMRLLRRPDPLIDLAVGLRDPARPSEWLLRSFCPPHYPDMRSAVTAFVEYKFANDAGTLIAKGNAAWRDPPAVRRQIPKYSAAAIEATVAYCEYVYERYRRFPCTLAPFENILAYQAHHLDVGFYDAFYRTGALEERHLKHQHNV